MSKANDLLSHNLLAQATCAVLIEGKVKGTAWLASNEGELITAGHVLGTKDPLTKVEIQFSEDTPRQAHKILWGYHQELGVDFAVLKLTNPPVGRHPLPVSLAKTVTGKFRLRGYGITLRNQSEGVGEFLGPFDPQNSSGNRLFQLRSPELGEGGYSGGAVFSDDLQAVVAVQIEATRAATGAGRDTILAMPLYRLAQHWTKLADIQGEKRYNPSSNIHGIYQKTESLDTRIMETDLESTILDALFAYYNIDPSSPEMSFAQLYEAISVSSDDRWEVQYGLFRLEESGRIKCRSLPDGSGDIIKITPEGIKVAQDRQKTIVSIDQSCPSTLAELIQRHPPLADLIRPDEVLDQIKKHFSDTSDSNLLVLYGEPLVGKTKLLSNLSAELGDEYVSLMVTTQGLNALERVDDFAFDLADQLTNRLRKWAESRSISHSLSNPKRDDFQSGWEKKAFETYWDVFQKNVGERQTVIIFDEIEYLLDYPGQLDPQIFMFLKYFVSNPENGYFILAGSERIHYSDNILFSELIGKGQSVEVRYYDEGVSTSILSAIRNYIAYPDDTLQCFVALCDGHPRFLSALFEEIVSQVDKSPNKQSLERRDIDQIITNFIRRTNDCLWALYQRLSAEELLVLKLISQQASIPIKRLEFSWFELIDLANQHSIKSSINNDHLSKGLVNLHNRQWLEWKEDEKSIQFKLGVFPLWLRHYHITLTK